MLQPLEVVVEDNNDAVSSVAFSPDGKHIVVGSTTLQLWNVGTRKLKLSLKSHQTLVDSVAFSPDGKYIVSSGDAIKLWDVKTGDQLFLKNGWFWDSLAFSPDGKCIVSGSIINKTIILLDPKTGEQLQPPLEGHKDSVNSVAFSPDSKYIISGSSDCTIGFWDGETGKLLSSFLGHEGPVTSVVFSPDGKCIVSGSTDKTSRLWNVETKEQLLLRGHESLVLFHQMASGLH